MPRKIDRNYRERLIVQRDRMERALGRLLREDDVDRYAKLAQVYRAYLKEIESTPEPKKSKPQEVSESLDAILETADVDDDTDTKETEDN